nr:uncharacterized protein LOC127487750 [Oryctolagus cuniculus]
MAQRPSQSAQGKTRQVPDIHELKHLHLSRVPLTSLRVEPLRVLLENVAATLRTLDFLDFSLQMQFCNPDRLRELYMDSVPFLKGHLHQVLRCLSAPLEALSITNCVLSEADLVHLSQCPNIDELKHLHLSRVPLTSLRAEPLRVLLETVVSTLRTLDFLDCEITDSQLDALLPALSRSAQLPKLSCLGMTSPWLAGEPAVPHRTVGQVAPGAYPALQRSTAPRALPTDGVHRWWKLQVLDFGMPIMTSRTCGVQARSFLLSKGQESEGSSAGWAKDKGSLLLKVVVDLGFEDHRLPARCPPACPEPLCPAHQAQLPGNDLSMAALENLLRHTAQLDKLPPELYPALQRSTAPRALPTDGGSTNSPLS